MIDSISQNAWIDIGYSTGKFSPIEILIVKWLISCGRIYFTNNCQFVMSRQNCSILLFRSSSELLLKYANITSSNVNLESEYSDDGLAYRLDIDTPSKYILEIDSGIVEFCPYIDGSLEASPQNWVPIIHVTSMQCFHKFQLQGQCNSVGDTRRISTSVIGLVMELRDHIIIGPSTWKIWRLHQLIGHFCLCERSKRSWLYFSHIFKQIFLANSLMSGNEWIATNSSIAEPRNHSVDR